MELVNLATDTTLSALVSGGAVQIAKRAKPGIEGTTAYRLLMAFAGLMGGLQWAGTIWPAGSPDPARRRSTMALRLIILGSASRTR